MQTIAGVGEIIQAEMLADGRYNILLHGRSRIRIRAEGAPRGAALSRGPGGAPGKREGPKADDRTFGARLQELRAAHARLLVALGQSHSDVVGRLTVAGATPGAAIDRIVSAVVPDAEVRQRPARGGRRRAIASISRWRRSGELLTMVAGREGEEDEDESEDA